VVAAGGNLLLNVGPRGVDAQIPDEQQARLDWLGEWVVPHQRAIAGTRPWVRTGAAADAGTPIRYTARDDTLFAFLAEAGRVTLADVGATAATTVATVAGAPCPWHDTPGGLEVDVPEGAGGGPAVLALTHVSAGGG
jgi:alpha-L-fucosidase